MSTHGEAMFERLPSSSALQKQDNQGRKVLDNTIGEWFDNHDISELFEGAFLKSATGAYLDLHGKDLNIPRQKDETDDDYRERLQYESLGHLTAKYLNDVFNIEVYAKVDDFDLTENMLTTNNPCVQGPFMIQCNDMVKSILQKKFVFGGDVTWLTP